MNNVSIAKGPVVSLSKRLFALVPLLATSAFAMPCSSTQYDMVNWFVMGTAWSQQYHLTSNALQLQFQLQQLSLQRDLRFSETVRTGALDLLRSAEWPICAARPEPV